MNVERRKLLEETEAYAERLQRRLCKRNQRLPADLAVRVEQFVFDALRVHEVPPAEAEQHYRGPAPPMQRFEYGP